MKYKLLNYLKSSAARKWLNIYPNQDVVEIDPLENYNLQLWQLTQAKLTEISGLVATPNPVVFIIERDPLQFIAAFLASVIAEVNLFLCDPAWQLQEWLQVLQLVQPDLIYGDRSSYDLIAQIVTTNYNTPDYPNISSQALIMLPTGGTSGKIKFAMHDWSTLTASARGFQEYFDCPKINSFCTLPLYHVSGLMQLVRSLITKGSLTICPYKTIKAYHNALNQDYQDYFISLVPTQLQYLFESSPKWLAQFKTVLLGGAPARRSLLATARKHNIRIALTYGMTETASGIATLKPEAFLAGNYSNGRVLPHAHVEIDTSSSRRESNSKIGTIKISSTSRCLGYYPQLFTPGQQFITDDLGYFDRQGYLCLVGRSSHKIITGGKNVFPAEVEAAIYATELVEDVCVIGIGDRKWGQAVTAIYTPIKLAFITLIQARLRHQLAKYKQPKYWIEMDTIPRNNRGKINYPQVKAIALDILNQKKPPKQPQGTVISSIPPKSYN